MSNAVMFGAYIAITPSTSFASNAFAHPLKSSRICCADSALWSFGRSLKQPLTGRPAAQMVKNFTPIAPSVVSRARARPRRIGIFRRLKKFALANAILQEGRPDAIERRPLRGAEQSSRGDARLLDHQDPRDDAWRDRRRHRHDELARRDDGASGAERLSDRDRDVRRRAGRPGVGADYGAQLQRVALLGDHRCLDHVRDHACRLCRPLARDRLSGRVAAPARLRARLAARVVSGAWNYRRQHGLNREGRSLLLAYDHLLADARHRLGRLDRRCGTWIFGRSDGVRSGARGPCDPLLYDAGQPRAAILGGVYPDAAAWCDRRRLPRQAGCKRRARAQPADRFGGARGGDRGADPDPSAAPWEPSRRGGYLIHVAFPKRFRHRAPCSAVERGGRALISQIVCSVVGHRRSKSSAHRVGGEWRSWCKRCGTRLVRIRRSRWLPLNCEAPTQLFGPRVEEGGDVARVALADVQIGHRSPRRHVLRIANPALHILRIVREVAADDHAQRNAIERRPDHPGGGPNGFERMTAAASVLDEHCLATANVAAGRDARMHPHPLALFGIFDDDADKREHEQERRKPAEERFSGQEAHGAPPPTSAICRIEPQPRTRAAST